MAPPELDAARFFQEASQIEAARRGAGDDGWWIRLSDLSAGQGKKWVKEQGQTRPPVPLKYLYSWADPLFAGQITPPILFNPGNPGDIRSELGDYGAMLTAPDGAGIYHTLSGKGNKIWETQGTGWTDRTPAGLDPATQIFQLHRTFSENSGVPFFRAYLAACGGLQPALCSDDGVWWRFCGDEVGNYIYAYCFWDQNGAGGNQVHFIGGIGGSVGADMLRGGAMIKVYRNYDTDTGVQIGVKEGVVPFVVGQESAERTVLACGPFLHVLTYASGYDLEPFAMPFAVQHGARMNDEFVVSPGDTRVFAWRWDRPLRDISPWGLDGCPPDLTGRIVGLMDYGIYTLALWRLASTGKTLVMWYNPLAKEAGAPEEERGAWHIRSRALDGSPPKGNHTFTVGGIYTGGALLTSYNDESLQDDSTTIGTANNKYQQSQGFKVAAAAKINHVRVRLKKWASPPGGIICEIQADDDTGKPNGTVLAHSRLTLDATAVNGTYFRWYTFPIVTDYAFQPATQYHIVLRLDYYGASPTHDETGYYWGLKTAGTYPDGQNCYKSGTGPWTALAKDCLFEVWQTQTPTEWLRLWLLTDDGTTARGFYQDHPNSLNPLESAATEYEPDYHYVYFSTEDLVVAGDLAGAIKDAWCNATYSSSLGQIKVDYRVDYDHGLSEGDANAEWRSVAEFNDTFFHYPIEGGRGDQAVAVQFRAGLKRGSSTTDFVVLRDLLIWVERVRRRHDLR